MREIILTQFDNFIKWRYVCWQIIEHCFQKFWQFTVYNITLPSRLRCSQIFFATWCISMYHMIGLKLPWSQRLSFNLSFVWKFMTRSADRSAEPREKKAFGQDRWKSHFHAGSGLDSSQRCHFLLTNHIPKDI